MAYGTLLTDAVQSSTANTPPQFKDGNGTQVGTLCRAWVNFDGTTSPGTIRASFNVSSVTRSATGVFAINFTNALSDTNYSVAGGASGGSTGTSDRVLNAYSYATGSVGIVTQTGAGSAGNYTYSVAAVFR